MVSPDESIRRASRAEGEELWKLLRDPRADVTAQAVHNGNFSEEMALFVARRRDVNFDILTFIPVGYPSGQPGERTRKPLSEVCEVVK